jgi:hypothetical protein
MAQPVCRFLRKKSYYTADKNETTLTEAAPARQFWCVRSAAAMGPDDRVVGPLDCIQERACFDTNDVMFV